MAENKLTKKKITLEFMMKYIEEKAPNDKAWFKKVAYQNKDGETQESYQHLNAVNQFCDRYEEFAYLNDKKEKEPNKSLKLENW